MATLEQIAQALQAGTPGQVLGIAAGQTIEPITPSGSGPSPSSSTPASIGAPAVGVSLDYARADHAHGGALADLSDVAATAPTAGQVLAWGGSEWAPATPAAAPSPSSSTPASIGAPAVGVSLDYARADHAHGGALADLSDVAATPPTSGQVLAWSGSEWAPATAPSGGPWQEAAGIISPTNPGSVAQVDVTFGAVGVAVTDTSAAFASRIAAGAISAVDTGGVIFAAISAVGEASLSLRGDTGGAVIPKIVATDFDTLPTALDLQILDLQINGAAGNAGEVLTSQGGGAAPTWAPVASDWTRTAGQLSPTVPGDYVLIGDGAGNDTTINPAAITLFRMTPGDCAIYASPALDLQLADELKINGATSSAGDVLTSNGPGLPPTWQPAAGGGGVDVQVFTTTGANTWTKPAGASVVEIIAIGGGGGGGGGQLRAATNIRAGGTGGGGGAVTRSIVPASLLSATESITVGDGGTGGAAQTTTTGLGADGNPGQASSFGAWAYAGGGGGGKGANGSNDIQPGIAGAGLFAGAVGGDTTTTAGAVGGTASGGGGGGGGGTSPVGSTSSNGGTGGAGPIWVSSLAGGAGGTGGAGSNGTGTTAGAPFAGAGGGGGASSGTGQGFDGGNGGSYGGGGGGGGGGTVTASGGGGNGSSGIVVVVTYL